MNKRIQQVINTAIAKFARNPDATTPPHTVLFDVAGDAGYSIQVGHWTPHTWNEDDYWELVAEGDLDGDSVFVNFPGQCIVQLEWEDEHKLRQVAT